MNKLAILLIPDYVFMVKGPDVVSPWVLGRPSYAV